LLRASVVFREVNSGFLTGFILTTAAVLRLRVADIAGLKEPSEVNKTCNKTYNKSCKICTTVAALISILFQLAVNDGAPHVAPSLTAN